MLVCSESESHWSDELTALHEAEAGDGTHPIDRASRRLALRSVALYLRNAASDATPVVLEIGSSSGYFLRDFRARFPAQPIIGADYLPSPMRRLARSLSGVPLVQFDLRTCPLPSGSIAGVVCLNVLEHIDDDTAALRQIHRVLRRGGFAHVEVPACPSCYDIYDEHLLHHRRYRMAELVRKVTDAGFEVLSRTHLGALVFPAFYAVKRRNRRRLHLPAEQKAELVRQMMRTTRRSRLMELAMNVELFLGRWIAYPAGIRCVVVLRK